MMRTTVLPLVTAALREDGAAHDVTSITVIPPDARISARIIAKAPGVIAGTQVAAWTFEAVDDALRCDVVRPDGRAVGRGDAVLAVEGSARSIFAAERTALNFLGHLSGIATLTRQFVQRVHLSRAQILDTRKTLPGLRMLEKQAVTAGGGRNHRLGLADALLIKTNHLEVLRQGTGSRIRGIAYALRQAQRRTPRQVVGVEVTTLAEFRAALAERPSYILLDNWSLPMIRQAVALRRLAPRPQPWLEVSGGVTLENVRAIAKTKVDRISIGRLTHSAPALDVSLEVVTPDTRHRTPA
jgi:nicotinate-nucleotide pyrophosphorylase (carboxylating)